jgi:hypothetical protein
MYGDGGAEEALPSHELNYYRILPYEGRIHPNDHFFVAQNNNILWFIKKFW